MKKDLSNQVAATYKMLRLGLAILAFAFPPLLYFGGRLIANLPLAGSMSAYYHYYQVKQTTSPNQEATGQSSAEKDAPGQGVMRNEFVGILFVVGGLLFAYQGFSRLEDYALDMAGILAWGVALVPMKWPEGTGGGFISPHGAIAISFFISIAYVCIWRAGDTLPLINDATMRKRYLRTYKFLGWAMALFPFMAWAFISLTPWRTSTIFFIELAGIYVFATYWMVKSHEASRTNVDKKASRGELYVKPHGLSDTLSAIPVTPVDNAAQQRGA